MAAAAKLIKTGEIVPVDLPLNVPSIPAFHRKPFHRNLITLVPGIAYDEEYSMNPQSGTQFDGFRHFAHIDSGKFYNGTTGAEIEDPKCMKCSVHHWAEHGIASRAVLIDYWTYAKENGKTYDVFSHHSITWDELNAAAKSQGLDIRPAAQGGDIQIGDILMIRSGWVETYYTKSEDEIRALGHRKSELGPGNETVFAGIAQEEKMLDWLHDCYFAAVAGDAPAMEAWPTKERKCCERQGSFQRTLTTYRVLPPFVHPCAVGYASRRDAGSGEAGRDLQKEEPVDLLLHVCSLQHTR